MDRLSNGIGSPTWRHRAARALGLVLAAVLIWAGGSSQPVQAAPTVPTYLSVYPVAGTGTGGQVTLRVKLWNKTTWNEAPNESVTVTLGANTRTLTTDAQGEATVRLPYATGDIATATFAPTANLLGSTDSNDFAVFGKPQGDLVFLVDESNSMGTSQANMVANLNLIATTFAGLIDYQVGLVGFGALQPYTPQTRQVATDEMADFSAAAAALQTSGGTEPGLDAIVAALQSRVGIRPEAQACLVLITDEETNGDTSTAAQAAAALAASHAILYSIINTPWGALVQDYVDLAVNSGGQVFNIYDFNNDPAPVMQAVADNCAKAITQRPDLSVTVTDNKTTTAPGDQRIYTVTVKNDGPIDATGVTVTLTLDPLQQVITASNSGTITPAGAGTGPKVTWTLPGTLAPGASTTLTVTVKTATTAQAGDNVTADAVVSDDNTRGADLTPANNKAQDTTRVVLSQVINLAVPDTTKVYGDADPAFTLTGVPTGWVEGTDYTVTFTRVPGENVGDYQVTAQVTILAPGFTLGTVTPGKLTITPRPLTVRVGSTTVVETGAVQTVDLAVGGAVGLRSGDQLATTSTQVSGTAVGSYPSQLLSGQVNVTRGGVDMSANYQITVVQGELTITPVPAPIAKSGPIPKGLASTGANVFPIVFFGLALTALGLLLLSLSWRPEEYELA